MSEPWPPPPAPASPRERPTILVTGATGFVGRAMVPALVRSGWRVRAAARDVSDLAEAAGVVRAPLPDLSRPPDWRPLLDGVDAVVHLAGIAHMSRAIPEARYTAVNAEAVASLASAAHEAGVRRVVFMSSVRAQSGPMATGVLTEASPPAPTDAYGRSKLAGERALADALPTAGTTDWCILRPVLIYGPGVKGNMATLIRLAATDWPLPLGALNGRRSVLAIENAIAAVEHALTSPLASRRTFLVADEEPVTVPDILTHLRRGFGQSPGLVPVPTALLAAVATMVGKGEASARVLGDLIVDTAALRATGWYPSTSTAAALEAAARDERARAVARSSNRMARATADR
ncbi:MAG: NAD-dependent epimerase/dehydratase family protein [Hyphomicrobiaceae bacterium]|nr:NAD-dependent epimerase/dehydratase family protein [Hyphomicrobiaceae bacterium]